MRQGFALRSDARKSGTGALADAWARRVREEWSETGGGGRAPRAAGRLPNQGGDVEISCSLRAVERGLLVQQQRKGATHPP